MADYNAEIIIRDKYVFISIPAFDYSFQIYSDNSIVGGLSGDIEQITVTEVTKAIILHHEQRNMVKGAGA